MSDAAVRDEMPAPASSGTANAAAIERWVEPMLLAARLLEVPVSAERVRSASGWAAKIDLDQGIVDLASSAGMRTDAERWTNRR